VAGSSSRRCRPLAWGVEVLLGEHGVKLLGEGMVKITMPDGQTGVVEYPPRGSALRYRVWWSGGSEGTITPGQFQDEEKAPLDDERA